MKSTLLTAWLVLSLAYVSAEAAQGVRIEGEKPREGISVRSNGASVVSVVSALGAKYGFKVTTIGSPRPRALHGVYQGPLETVLRRILNQESFVVVRDPSPVVGYDFIRAPKRRPHLIRTVKVIGSGPSIVVRNVPRHPPRRKPVSLSQRFKPKKSTPQLNPVEPPAMPRSRYIRRGGSES